jgi:hypothetical protein
MHRTSHFTHPGATASAVALFAALALVEVSPAAAAGANGSSSPGVINIDQAKAEAGGVTANDTPGFPVTISQSGTYRLTSNLVVGNPNTTVIEVTADNVTLDLNGYAILGATSCSGEPTVCYPVGSGDGVRFTPANRKANLAISNGTIRGMGGGGINVHTASSGFLVDNVRVVSNGGWGMVLNGANVTNSVVMRNGVHGIGAHSSLISGNTIVANGGAGLFLVRSGFGGNSLVGNNAGGMQLSLTESAPVAPNFCNVALCP